MLEDDVEGNVANEGHDLLDMAVARLGRHRAVARLLPLHLGRLELVKVRVGRLLARLAQRLLLLVVVCNRRLVLLVLLSACPRQR